MKTTKKSAGRIEPMVIHGDYVLATKYHDGDPNDYWVVGFFSEMLHKTTADRYMVVDDKGKNFRGNGFRRVKKISGNRGKWLLDNKQNIEHGSRSLWWWLRQSMNG